MHRGQSTARHFDLGGASVYLEADIEAAAIERAVVLFSLDDARRKRLAINLRR